MSASITQTRYRVRVVKMSSGEVFIGKECEGASGHWPETEDDKEYTTLDEALFVHAQVAQTGQMSTALLPWLSTKLKLRTDSIAVELEEIPQILQDQYTQATSGIQIANSMPPTRQ